MRIHEIDLDGYEARWSESNSKRGPSLATWGSFGLERLHLNPGEGWQGMTVTATFLLGDNEKTMVADADGMVDVPPQALAEAGNGVIVFSGDMAGAQRITADIRYKVIDHSEVRGDVPEPTPDAFHQYIEQTNQYREEAAASAASAAASAQQAAASADGAAGSASAASASASAAKTSETNAAASKTAAASSASAASASASAAKTSETNAASSKTAAANSATAAAGSAGEAADSATAAAASKTAAAESAGEAADSADEAAVSKTAAAGSASAASASASAAKTSETNAAASKTAAASSASAASASASAAKTSETNAASSKTAAANSATAAAGSAGEAADSATAAAASKTAAASSASAAAQFAQAAQEAAKTALGIIDDEAVTADSTWSSKQIIDAICPPLEETGNPVQCYPVAGYPLGVKASWEPRQEGEGDPSPENIRAISGVESATVTRCGKNLWNFSLDDTGTYWIIPYLPAGTYTMSMLNTADWWTDNSNKDKFYLRQLDNSMLIATLYFSSTVVGERSYATFEVANGGGFRVDTYRTDIPTKITDIQLELGSTATSYAPYTGTAATLALPETIYGGTVDAVTGVGSARYIYRELAISDMDNSESYPGWNNVAWINDVKHNHVADGNFAGLGIYGVTNVADILRGFFWNSNGTQVYTLPVFWGGKTQSQIKEAYPDLVVQFCLQLVTPTPFQATGSQPLPALSGQNVLITNADSLTVTGRADPNHTIQTLSDRIAALESETIEGGTNA